MISSLLRRPAVGPWFVLDLLFTLALAGGIAAASLVPGEPAAGDSRFTWFVAGVPSFYQNVAHVALYGVLTAAVASNLSRATGPRRAGWLAAIACGAFGLLLEWAQLAIPGRYGTLLDAGLNLGGAIAGALAHSLFTGRATD